MTSVIILVPFLQPHQMESRTPTTANMLAMRGRKKRSARARQMASDRNAGKEPIRSEPAGSSRRRPSANGPSPRVMSAARRAQYQNLRVEPTAREDIAQAKPSCRSRPRHEEIVTRTRGTRPGPRSAAWFVAQSIRPCAGLYFSVTPRNSSATA